MDKRRTKVFRDKLLGRREGLVGQVQAAELYSRERTAVTEPSLVFMTLPEVR